MKWHGIKASVLLMPMIAVNKYIGAIIMTADICQRKWYNPYLFEVSIMIKYNLIHVKRVLRMIICVVQITTLNFLHIP